MPDGRGEHLPARLAEPTDRCLAETEELAAEWHGARGGLVRYVLNPRFALSCSEPLLAGVAELAERLDLPVHTHALEQRDETATVRRLKGGATRSSSSGTSGCSTGTCASPTASGSARATMPSWRAAPSAWSTARAPT